MPATFKRIEIGEYYGLCSSISKASMPLGFSSAMSNMDLSSPGIAKTRNGYTSFNSNLGYNAKTIFDYYKPSSQAHQFVGNGGTKVFTLNASGVKTEIGSSFTSGGVFKYVNFKNTLYLSNGESPTADRPKAWDGTTFRNWGIDAPSTNPSAAAGAAGALTGVYNYLITYYNSNTGHESNSNATAATVTLAGQRADLSSIPVSADAQVTRRRIYRTTAGGSIYFYLAEIADNSTTTYTDNALDATLSTQEVPVDNDPPPHLDGIEEWDGRIFGFERGGTKVLFSNDAAQTPVGAGLPEESFSPDNFVQLNLEVRAVKKSPNFNEIWVHTSRGIIALVPTGIADDPYRPAIRNTTWATQAPMSIVNIDNDQWFITENAKVMAVDSSGFVTYKSGYIEATLAGGRGLVGVNYSLLKTFQAVHYRKGTKNQYRIATIDSGGTNFATIFNANYRQVAPVDDFGVRSPVWEKDSITCTCMGIVKDSNNEDVLYFGTTDAKIMKNDFGTNDNGTAIDWSFTIGVARTSENPTITDIIKYIKAYYEPTGNFNISMRLDFNFGQSGGQVYSVGLSQVGDLLDSTFILDTSMLSGSGLNSFNQSVSGDYNYVEITFYGNSLDQILELHNLVLSAQETHGYRN